MTPQMDKIKPRAGAASPSELWELSIKQRKEIKSLRSELSAAEKKYDEINKKWCDEYSKVSIKCHELEQQEVFRPIEKDIFDQFAEQGIFVWVFPITYWGDGKIIKRVYGWEIEYNDGEVEERGYNSGEEYENFQQAKCAAFARVVEKQVQAVKERAKIDTSKLQEGFSTHD